jgi:hypothetical protein
MFADINQRMQTAAEKRLWKSKLERDLAEVQKKLGEQQALLAALEEQRRKEEVDVDRLQGLSLKALFATVLGSKEEQLQKERQELLKAEMFTRSAQRMVDSLLAESESFQAQLSGLKHIEGEYQTLLKEKEGWIVSQRLQNAGEISEFGSRLAQTNVQIKELQEAIQAGEIVRDELDEVLSALDSAAGWGVWDLLGGGLLSTVIKHDHMDSARDASERVKTQLVTFQRELSDLAKFEELNIDIEPVERFADLFLDGLLFDWVVQSKIVRSKEHTQSARRRVEELLRTLETRLTVAQGEAQVLRARQAALIEKS